MQVGTTAFLRRAGIVLVTTLLMMVLVLMMTAAVVTSAMGGFGLTSNFYDREAALLAAESGVQYAMTRLQDDAGWRGDYEAGDPAPPPAPSTTFSVLEEDGTVIGFLQTPNGWKSMFRMRFNYQDGDLGADQLDDPAVEYRLPIPFVSVNNLHGDTPMDVPRAIPDGSDYRVTASSPRPYQVPAHHVCLMVEGSAGWDLRDATAEDHSARVGGRRVSARLVEVYLKAEAPTGLDAVIMAGGDFRARVEDKVEVSTDDDAVPPRLRSKNEVTVAGGSGHNYVSDRGEVQSASGELAANYDARKVRTSVEDDAAEFYQLKWSDVRTADASPATTTAVHLPAGTYVWWEDKTLHYYDMELADYEAYMADPLNLTDSGTLVGSDLSEVRLNGGTVPGGVSAKDHKIVLTKNVHVRSTEAATGMAVIPRSGVPSPRGKKKIPGVRDDLRPEQLTIEFKPPQGKQAILSAEGSISLGGTLNGNGGTLTSGGDIEVVGSGTDLSANPNAEEGLNMYARGSIYMTSYNEKGGGSFDFRDLKFKGMIYAWGGFEADVYDEVSRKGGTLDLQGALVAYGGEPGNPDRPPGSEGGLIKVRAKDLKLKYDPDYLANLAGLTSKPRLQRVLWATY